MDLKKIIRDEVYNEFILNKEAITEENLKLFFSNSDEENRFLYTIFKNHKIYDQKIIVAMNPISSFIFFEKNKEKFIIMLTGISGFRFNNPMLVSATSTMKIDIIASDSWTKKNKELLDIVKLISENTVNIPKEVYNRGILNIKGFDEDLMMSPLLHYMSRKNNIKFKSRTGTLTKETFLTSVLKVIINRETKKETIFSKDLTKIKKVFYSKMLSKLIRSKTRHFFLEDIEKRGLSVIIDFIGVNLMDSVIYNRTEWNTYFQTEFKQNLLPEFIEHIFQEMTEEYIDKNTKNALSSELRGLEAEVNRENMNRILEEMITFSNEILNRNLLNNTLDSYSKKEVSIDIKYKNLTFLKKMENKSDSHIPF